MICPHCAIGEISEQTSRCELCGASASDASVATKRTAAELRETFPKELLEQFRLPRYQGRKRRVTLYTAQDIARRQSVVVRIFPLPDGADLDLRRRFGEEAIRAASFEHRHVLPIVGHGASSTFLWDAVEHPEGRSLAELVQESGPMDLGACLKTVSQVIMALDYLHARGTEHGDLSLSSIFVDSKESVHVALPSPIHKLGRTVGTGSGTTDTPNQTALEQPKPDKIDAGADQHALATIIYQCLTGTLVSESPQEIAARQNTEALPELVEFRTDLPSHVVSAIERAMSPTPAERFPSVHDFGAVVCRDWLPRKTPAAPTEIPTGSPRLVFDDEAHERRFPLRMAVLGVTGALAIAAGAVWLRWPEEPELVLPPMVQQPTTVRRPETEAPVPTDPEFSLPQEEAPPTRAVRPPAPGALFVNTDPWGQLYIDGTLIGNTPKGNLRIGPGTHTIRVVRFGFEPYERTIRVAPGQEIRMTNIVLQPRQP